MTDWVEEALAGQRRAIARVMTLLENAEGPEVREVLARIYPHTGCAHILGITGSPGAGKSTLLGQIASEYRRRQVKVGIVAVDPSSPYSGGALLGDRIRMRALSGDPGVFIRSMASRGRLGGVAHHTARMVQLLDACGYARILIETVGAGQAEVEIARLADTTLVLQVPGMGDDIQALKAGILEIADILVVNKADLDGADRLVASLSYAVVRERQAPAPSTAGPWQPPILKAVAITGEGVPEVIDAVERHVAYLDDSGARLQRQRVRVAVEMEGLVRDLLWQRFRDSLGTESWERIVDRVAARELDPYRAVEAALGEQERSS